MASPILKVVGATAALVAIVVTIALQYGIESSGSSFTILYYAAVIIILLGLAAAILSQLQKHRIGGNRA
jgi:ethanolamine transporter EutH